jgi:DNA-binding winged helix-turn-helix (wHTH) protein/TolB-like protein/tetratricopeptide (TPR) repeat protein
MENKAKGLFEFGPFRLEAAERRLWRDAAEPVQLPPKVFDLLVLLVENRGRLLDKGFLMESLWPGTFVEEANLSVNVSLLRKALGDGAGETYIETVPKRGYRFVANVKEVASSAEAAEALPAIVESAVKPEILTPHRAASRTRWWIWAGAGCLILLAILGWLVWSGILGGFRAPEIHSIAVLPFLPLDGNAAHNYLGLGMAEAVVTRLTAIPRITVRPTSAVVKYLQPDRDPLVAGRELQVDAVMVGTIQEYEKRIRVTVRLYRVRDGASIWAGKFDDNFTNIFAVQDAISERIADTLALKVTESERQHLTKRSTENTEAYQLYLQGQYLATKRFGESGHQAIEYYQRAVEKDPDYAAAYAALSYSCVLQAGEGGDEALKNQARMAAMKAISVDNQLADAHVALGDVLMRMDWDWTGADRAFSKAIAIDGNLATARAAKSILLTAFGRHDEAVREMEAACRLDPSSAILRSDLAWTLHFGRRYEEAVKESRIAVQLDPWSYTPRRQLSKALMMLSNYEEALKEARKALDVTGGHSRRVLAEVGKVYAAWGKTAEALAILNEVRQGTWKQPEPHYEVAVFLAALGEKDAALGSLKTAVDLKLARVVWIKSDPELDSLRQDPRFEGLLRQMRLAP